MVDNTAPVVTGCPANIVTTTGVGNTSCGKTVSWTPPTATDNCGGSVSVSSNYNPGDYFPTGTTLVSYLFIDAVGNTSTCTFNVTVNDDTKPEFTFCPSIISTNPNGAGCTATIATVDPAATDNCTTNPAITWVISGATSGSGTGNIGTFTFNSGLSTVTYTATDAAGNTQTCIYTVNVVNNLGSGISGTATVAQNISTTSNITFSGSGGTKPYTFTFNVNGGGTQTVSTTGSSSIVTVPQSNAVVGQYIYTLLSVTDANGCSGTLPADVKDTITVVGGVPDISVVILGGSATFVSGGSSVSNINVFNSGSGNTTAPVVIIIPKITGFNFTYNPTFSNATINNNEWNMTDLGGFLSFTSNFGGATPYIPAITGVRRFQIGVTATGSAGNTANQQVIAPAGTGGGETPTTNNTTLRTLKIN
ncbi:MAG: HYR domain-containing protein [Chitinophagaceae bacterium]|nr:HYR domain-containing protein [Chitinophagaceae bacterium]